MPVFYGTERLTYCMGRGGTGRNHRQTWSAGIVPYGYVSRSDVGNHSRDEERRHPFRAFGKNLFRLSHHGGESADAGSYIYTESERIYIAFLCGDKSGLLHSLPCRSHSIDGELVLFPCKRRLDAIIRRHKVLHLSCNLHRKVISRDGLDEIYSTDSVKEVPPIRLNIISYRRDHAHAGHYYSSRIHLYLY